VRKRSGRVIRVTSATGGGRARAICYHLPTARRSAAPPTGGSTVSTPSYEIFAIKYAEVGRKAWGNFVDGDPHEDSDMPLDYFVWAIVGAGRTIVVDTGFDGTMAK
jgi:hypothetical protein